MQTDPPLMPHLDDDVPQPEQGPRYKQQISRQYPGCIIFLLDQSDSMSDGIAGSPRPKSEALAVAINRFIKDLITECLKGDPKPLHRFDVGVVGYRTDAEGAKSFVGPALQGALAGFDLVSVVELFDHPLRTDVKEVDDGDGGLVKKRTYVWYDAVAEGGTPMMQALYHCYNLAAGWIARHPDSFPPIVIHFTDGEPTDGDPEPAAEALRALATTDGNVLLFNCHLSNRDVRPVQFPASESELPPGDDYSVLLYRMSSLLPEPCLGTARAKGYNVSPGARGMILNGDSTALIQLIQIGTQQVKRNIR
jgi:uncharacterized protein YegL